MAVPKLTILLSGRIAAVPHQGEGRTIQAYLRKDRSYFAIPDEEAVSLGAKFVVHLVWYGYTRTFFTHDFVEELLLKAGFGRVERCAYGETHSPYSGIVELDNREEESLFVEAIK